MDGESWFRFGKIDVTACSKELLRNGCMPTAGRGVERRRTVVHLKINVTASFYQLLRDGRMPTLGGHVERRDPILFQKIDVTAVWVTEADLTSVPRVKN